MVEAASIRDGWDSRWPGQKVRGRNEEIRVELSEVSP